MRDHTAHLTDHDLLLALDGELPARQQAAADAHLTECQECWHRRSRLAGTTVEVTALHRSDVSDAAWMEKSKTRLRAALTASRTGRPALWRERVFDASGPSWWAVAGAAAVVAFLLVEVVNRQDRGDARPYVAPIERGALPIRSLTPGATWNVPLDELCAFHGREQQAVSDAVRDHVLRSYRMEGVPADEYELDYLITPDLGGAPEVQNLWPQRFALSTWNAYVKDQLEDLLPRLVCEGTLQLETAQRDIAKDWVAAYKKYFKTDTPLSMRASLAQAAPPRLRLISFPAAR